MERKFIKNFRTGLIEPVLIGWNREINPGVIGIWIQSNYSKRYILNMVELSEYLEYHFKNDQFEKKAIK